MGRQMRTSNKMRMTISTVPRTTSISVVRLSWNSSCLFLGLLVDIEGFRCYWIMQKPQGRYSSSKRSELRREVCDRTTQRLLGQGHIVKDMYSSSNVSPNPIVLMRLLVILKIVLDLMMRKCFCHN